MKAIHFSRAAVLAATLGVSLGPTVAQGPRPTGVTAVSRPAIERGTRLQGTAFINRNRKVTGASVLIRPKASGSHIYVTSSDHGGLFQIDALPDGQYRVEVQREGMAREVKDDIVLRFPFRAVVDLPMEPASAERPDVAVPTASEAGEKRVAVTGHVTGRDGLPLADVLVRFARWDSLADPVNLHSSTDGGFEIPELLVGPWRLEVEAVGFLPIRMSLTLDDPAELVVVLVEQPADYDPSPLELLPPEEPVEPPGLPRVLIVN